MDFHSAFRGDRARKDELIRRLKQHVATGTVLAGSAIAWNGTSGSLSGCLAHAADLHKFEEEVGLPRGIGALVDRLDAFVDPPDARQYEEPLHWLIEIQPGADLASVPACLLLWMFEDSRTGFQIQLSNREVLRLVEATLALHRATIARRSVATREWAMLRRDLIAFSDTAGPLEDGDRTALSAAEAGAWPLHDSASALTDVFRIHVNGPIDVLGRQVKSELGWREADDEAIQGAFQRRASGATQSSDASLLSRLQELRTAFNARKNEIVAPYWDRLRQLCIAAPLRPAHAATAGIVT